MPTKKPPPKSPIKNRAVTGKATTPSGNGVVNMGRLAPKKASDGNNAKSNSARPTGRATNRDVASISSTPQGNWYENMGDASHRMSERDRKRMSAAAHTMGENFHAMGDFLVPPDLGTDPDRPSGRTSKLADQRLYQTKQNNKTKSTTTRSGTTKAAGLRTKRGR